MKIKEFADKYHLTYQQAYVASYGAKPASLFERERDYQEDELFENMIDFLHERQFEAQRKAREAQRKISEMNKIRGVANG